MYFHSCCLPHTLEKIFKSFVRDKQQGTTYAGKTDNKAVDLSETYGLKFNLNNDSWLFLKKNLIISNAGICYKIEILFFGAVLN